MLDTNGLNRGASVSFGDGGGEEGGLALVALYELDLKVGPRGKHYCNYKAREAGAAAEIDKRVGVTRDKWHELGGIKHVPLPQPA
jgi:hypothetical protein